jgi:hypothetical protein
MLNMVSPSLLHKATTLLIVIISKCLVNIKMCIVNKSMNRVLCLVLMLV